MLKAVVEQEIREYLKEYKTVPDIIEKIKSIKNPVTVYGDNLSTEEVMAYVIQFQSYRLNRIKKEVERM